MPNALTTRGAKGDMLKSIYDTEDQGIVDDSKKLEAATKPQVQAHAPEPHAHEQAHITDLDHDAQKIKAVTVDDTAKADQKVLAYDQAEDKLAYVPKCPEIVIKAIQHVTFTILDGDLTAQVLINQVDIDNTFLIYSGHQCASNFANSAIARIELTDSTHITATRGGAADDNIIHICVIECTAGINSVQRGTISLSSLLYNDETISTVDTDKTFVSYLGVTSNGSSLNPSLVRVSLLDSTTVRAQHNDYYTAMTVSYEVIEFI